MRKDFSEPKILFDYRGVCDQRCTSVGAVLPKWEAAGKGGRYLFDSFSKISEANKDSGFDCIIWMSVGTDNSYLTSIANEGPGLRLLVFDLDAGWSRREAVSNIERLADRHALDLYTEVTDWPEMRDLQLAYFKSGAPHIDIPRDHAFFAALYKFAEKRRVRYILTGANLSTECVHNPREWMWYQSDSVRLRDFHRKFGTRPLVELSPTSTLRPKLYLPYVRDIRVVRPLNYMRYVNEDAIKRLVENFVRKPSPQKHLELGFTRFCQGYWLPTTFGYDTHLVQYSGLILTNQMTREETLGRLKEPAFDADTVRQEFACVARNSASLSKSYRVTSKRRTKLAMTARRWRITSLLAWR